MSDDICFTPAVELASLIRQRKLSPREVVEAVIARSEKVNPKINALITKTYDLARHAADQAEQVMMSDGAEALGPLAGIPISIKDLTPTAGVRTTYGVHDYEDNVPEEDAPIAARVRAAGGALIGKSSTPPFGWLGTTWNEVIGMTNNPWDLGRSAGGSSGGAGALVAAGVGQLATGSDGGGSIRLPAALNGVVGHKPTHGRIPRATEAPLFDTVDALGPMTRTVADAALLLSVLAGPIEDEPYMLPEVGVDYVADLRASATRGLRVAYSPNLGHGQVEPEVAAIVKAAVDHFQTVLGAAVDEVEIEIPEPMDYFMLYYTPQILGIGAVEPGIVRLWERFPGLVDRFKDLKAMSATEWWQTVTQQREMAFRAFAKLFGAYDILLTPTAPVAAWEHDGAVGPMEINGEPVRHPTIDYFRFTEPFGHSGHPALTINAGFTSLGLPVGLQIVGGMRNDAGVLRAAAAYEATTAWTQQRPKL